MKNKTLKNLIAVGFFTFFLVGVNSAAAYVGNSPYTQYTSNVYYDNYSNNNYSQRQQLLQQEYAYQQQELALQNQLDQQKYAYDQQKLIQQQNLANQKTQQIITQPYTYVSAQPRQQVQQIQYVPQQTVQTVQYVPAQQQAVQYVNTGSSQGASVINSGTTRTTKVVAVNSGTASNTGQYVNYDTVAYNNNANLMGANAYGLYNTTQPVVVDSNGVTALSVNGSGSFMPSSVFQWFLLIILILAIIIIARMVSKTFSKDPHATPAH